MQYLTLFLLVGLGLASAYTSDFDADLSIDRFENVDLTPFQAGGWISEQMRQTLEKMVEGFEKALEEGKTISERAFRKAEEIYHKLLDWGIDVGEKIKEALEKIGKDFENIELDQADNLLRAGDWITDRMREALEKMVEGFEKAIGEGKTISEKAFRKAEELYHKLLDWGIDVGEKIKEAFERIAKDFDKNRDADLENPMQAGNWISDQMRQTLEKMVEAFEKAIEEGKTVSERAFRKAEEIYHKLLDWGIDVGEKIKEAIERIGKDFEKNELDRSDNLLHAGNWISDQMRQTLEKMVESFEKALEEGKTISESTFRKAEEIYHKLLDWGIDVGEKIKEAIERIGKDFDNNREQRGPMIDRLKEAFENVVNKMKEAFENGSGVRGDLMKKAEDIYEKLKNLKVEISDKIRSIFEDLKSKMGRNSVQQGPMIDRLKEAFENIVSKIKERFDSGNGVSGDLMKKAEDIYEKLKNLKVEISEKIRSIFEDLKSKMGRNSVQRGPMIDRLKEAFENIVNKMKEAFESGSGVRGDLMKKAEDIYEKLKNLKVEISEKIRSIFEDLKSKMGRHSVQRGAMIDRLKEAFERIVNKIKERFDSGSGVSGDLMKKAEDIFEKLKNLKVEISDKIKSIFEDVRSKMGRSGPTAVNADISNIFDIFRRLKKLIKEKFDTEKLKEKVEELFGKGSEVAEQIIELLTTKGEKAKQKILDWIDRILPEKEERSISEVYDKLREFFKDLQLDLKERFTKFGEWVKEQYEKGLEKGKTRAENIKKIAKEFIDDTKVIGKDMAEEALGFFREYKMDLGKLYDNVVDKIGKILKS